MDARILAALAYIERNIGEQISLESTAQHVGLSKFHFHRLFQAEVGQPFYAYVRRVRMHGAAARLKWTSQSMLDIAVSYGYGSNAAFTRAFRSYWGVSPIQYRTNNDGWSAEEYYEGVSLQTPLQVQVREIGSYPCVFRRYTGPYKYVQDHWRDFLARLPEALRGDQSGQFLGRVYDDPRITPPDEIRYDCCYLFPDAEDARLKLDEVQEWLVMSDAGLYAVVDNNHRPRPRPEVYAFVLDVWMPKTSYRYSDVPALEIFATSPVEANDTWAPACTMLVPLE
ncbi:MAG TPA: helix-turn-helix domain-containing protein [Gammaproteobacteria bacterium]